HAPGRPSRGPLGGPEGRVEPGGGGSQPPIATLFWWLGGTGGVVRFCRQESFMATVTDSRGRPLSGSITASIAVTFITLCALIPYALVAAGLRFGIARVFFLFGQ